MGIYGNSLLSFPEQMQTVAYFNQDPSINAGFENKTADVTKRGVLHSTGARSIKDSNGNLVTVNRKEFWSMTELTPGYFIRFGTDVYRIGAENNWAFEDGFYKYVIEKVVGDSGTITVTPAFNDGSENMQ